ncbi:MAG: DUF418 domain-containing protein, partial [Betaproteobacteria bacterium]
MESATPVVVQGMMAPVAANQRIEALDVVRGFALLGIFLMNIEWFSRPMNTFNEGMPRDLTGLDWLASWFIAYFVQGKFWTIFSLLFGMGFAVMMVRAEQAGREFTKVYVRRVIALAVFGAVHYIFLWEGDILFSYAIAALMLMVVLFAKPKPMMIAIAITAGLGFIPYLDNFFGVAAGLGAATLVSLYLRSERRVNIRGHVFPIFSFILLTLGTALVIAAAVFWILPDGPVEPRLPLTVFGPMVLLTGWLSWKYYEPVEKRSVRLAVSLYLFFAFAMTAGGLVQHFSPDPDSAISATAQKAKDDKQAAALPQVASSAVKATAELKPVPAVSATSAAESKTTNPGDRNDAAKTSTPASAKAAVKAEKYVDEKKPKKTKEQRAAERKAEREKRLAENLESKATELRIFTRGNYVDVVLYRAARFLDKASGDFGFAMILIGMFLLGVWFVRSGVMENTRAHLPFFRKLAFIGLPLGIGLGLLGSLIAMSHTPGDRYDGWGIARGMMTIGNLPACLGYVGMVVLMLHSNSAFSHIRILGPLGRMALTNYLTQSLICSIYFYGYALGHWGMPRAQQVVFVLIVYAAQIAFSQWWLSKFRYGPMEWFWRGFTYRQIP